MKILLLPLYFLITITGQAQYYYSDIIGATEINRQMKSYLDNKVKVVSAIGYDQRGTRATDFSEAREVKESGKVLRVSTIVSLNKSTVYTTFDSKGKVISVTDSSSSVESLTEYEYDASDRLIRVRNTIKDPANDFNQVEMHVWSYSTGNQPLKMWRTINNTDSLEVRFLQDEKGNPGEETSFKNGQETGKVYYYYDQQNRLTDIVRYNNKVKKLLPDNIISYDDSDRVIQVITSTPADKYGRMTWVGYQTWRYVYNEQGLKTAEALFNNEQEMTGRIKYNYTFTQ